jgi:hypothetical protein
MDATDQPQGPKPASRLTCFVFAVFWLIVLYVAIKGFFNLKFG